MPPRHRPWPPAPGQAAARTWRVAGRTSSTATSGAAKAADRHRLRAERQAPERRKAGTISRRTRVTQSDPERASADAEAFRCQFERETLASLRADPGALAAHHGGQPR